MTTTVRVDASGQKVLVRKRTESGDYAPDVILESGETQTFYIHGDEKLSVTEAIPEAAPEPEAV